MQVSKPGRGAVRRVGTAMVAGCVAHAAPAAAQTAGHYQGANSEGGTVDVYVAGSGGSFMVTQADDSATIYCKTANGGGWTVTYFGNVPFTGSKTTISSLSETIFYGTTLTFSGNAVSGKVQFALPEFIAPNAPPKVACASKSHNDSFSATLLSADTRPPRPPGAIAGRMDPGAAR